MSGLSSRTLKRKEERNQRLIAQLRSKTWNPPKVAAISTSVKVNEPVSHEPLLSLPASPQNGNASWQWSEIEQIKALQSKEIIPGRYVDDQAKGLLHVQVSMNCKFLDGSTIYTEWFAWLKDCNTGHFDVLLQEKDQFQKVGLLIKVLGTSVMPNVWTVVPEIKRLEYDYSVGGDLELSLTRH